MTENSICLKPISELLADSEGRPTRFLIPAYQRGYRWKPLQVTQLLNDVWEFVQTSEGNRHAFYCLQPVVVKPNDDGSYELVDGQQRLTTIYILLTYLKELVAVLGKARFDIDFETRGETNRPFLAAIDLSRAGDNVDFFHICEAYNAIEAWFSGRDAMQRLKLLQHFLNDDESGRNVKVIWYQLALGDNPVDAFTRLNVGKIPLTNGELIRALFLRKTAHESAEAEPVRMQIAHEWDLLEKALQSDTFWYFLNNASGSKENRIGFLFDLVAREDGMPSGAEHDPYGVFFAFNEKIRCGAIPYDEWLKIKQAYMMLEEWFEDRTLYHIVGFLIHHGVTIAALRRMSYGVTKNDFEKRLRQEVFDRVICDEELHDLSESDLTERVSEALAELEHGRHSAAIRSVLLLFNVASLLDDRRSNLRFQFDSFKQEIWDIEHVRSVAEDQPQRHNDRVEWLRHSLRCLQVEQREPEIQQQIGDFLELSQPDADDESFEELFDNVLGAFGESQDDESAHRIANLTLLDKATNRSYKNAVFAVKRHRLLSLDRAGIFVPLCTRNVFLKAYSSRVDNMIFWSKDDADAYQASIVNTLVRFFQGRQDRTP